MVQPDRPHNNMAHAYCVLYTQGHKHTLWICNTYCLSTAIAVTRSCLSDIRPCLLVLQYRFAVFGRSNSILHDLLYRRRRQDPPKATPSVSVCPFHFPQQASVKVTLTAASSLQLRPTQPWRHCRPVRHTDRLLYIPRLTISGCVYGLGM